MRTKIKVDRLPDHALKVTEYEEFRQIVKTWVDGNLELLTILGNAGIGKSETVVRSMNENLGPEGRRWKLHKGKASPLFIYSTTYRYRLRPMVLDDVDSLLDNKDTVSVLKCLCDTKPVKRVEWGSHHPSFSKKQGLPTSFEAISPVCIIANSWETLNKNITALQDRGMLLYFAPSAMEVHREVGRAGWFDDQEVFEFIGRNLYLIVRPSFRFYINAKKLKDGGLEWKSMILRTIENETDPKTLMVARLLADPRYDKLKAPEAARERAFEKMGGGSRATYHRHKQELEELRGEFDPDEIAKIKLKKAERDEHTQKLLERRKQLEALRAEEERLADKSEEDGEDSDDQDGEDE